MVVVDASVLVDALLERGSSRARIAGEVLAAPHLVDAECGSAFRDLERRGELEPKVARRGLANLAEIEIFRFEHGELLQRAWALRHNLTFYDALYVALAEGLNVPLLTLDARVPSAPGVQAVVEVIPTPSGR